MSVHPPVFVLVQAEEAKQDDAVPQADAAEVPPCFSMLFRHYLGQTFVAQNFCA